jgi:ABC-type glycerol-3-phosphate transport system permease component
MTLAHVRVLPTLGRVALYALLVVLSLIFLLPFIWMISTSLKTDPQVYRVPPIWIPNPVRWANYPEALTSLPFLSYFLNTLKIAVPATIGTLLSSSLAAYGFSRIRWPERDALFYVCVATMMIPFQVQMIPLFVTFKHLGWINTYLPLVVPTFFASPFSVFMLRQFFLTIPQELSDAARIDGCSELGIFGRIILPLAKPALAVVALFTFMWAWSDYLGPLIYLNQTSKFTVALGLQQLRATFHSANQTLVWPYLMAASTATIAPIVVLFFFTQRTFIEGISLTGIKG